MTATAYGNFLLHQAKADIDWDTVSLKAMLCDSSYVPDFDADEFRADITGEVTGTGYTAGGVALTTVAISLDTTNNWLKFDADDANFGTLTVSGITQLVIYVDTGSAATDILISCHTFSTQSPSGQPFTYAFHANGMGYITY